MTWPRYQFTKPLETVVLSRDIVLTPTKLSWTPAILTLEAGKWCGELTRFLSPPRMEPFWTMVGKGEFWSDGLPCWMLLYIGDKLLTETVSTCDDAVGMIIEGCVVAADELSDIDAVLMWLADWGNVTTTIVVGAPACCCRVTVPGMTVAPCMFGIVIVVGSATPGGTVTVVPWGTACIWTAPCIMAAWTVTGAGAIGIVLNWLGTRVSGQNLVAGRLWILDFLAFGPSGLLASNMGCKMRRLALINLQIYTSQWVIRTISWQNPVFQNKGCHL